MDSNVLLFFSKIPQALPLYFAFEEKVCAELAPVKIKVQKTQITFANKYNFAAIWLPIRKMKNRPDVYIIITFGLPYRISSPRIIEAVEPYPMRWTHHVIVQYPEDIDDELIDWIKSSYSTSMQK